MRAVIAGIDGSQAAVTAALWGVDEANSRAVPLRLISVIAPTHVSPDDYARDLAHAESSLNQAQDAVAASGKGVTVETEIPRGPAGVALIEASRDADMVCVGSVGIGRYARSLLGSTATDLAEKANCPVAVIRTESDQPPPEIDWVVVRMTDAADNDVVIKHAAREANLRRAPMLVLGGRPEELTGEADGTFERRVQELRQHHPEVRVYPITTKLAIASFLRTNGERVRLAVISASEADQLVRLIGPAGHPLFRHPECSVLVVRG